MRALIVDDNSTMLFLLSKMVQSAGIADVTWLKDPIAALEAAEASQFDLILVDYMMPGLDGLEFVRRIRLRPSYEDVPLVMVTTTDERDVCYAALEAGATDFLRKPIDVTEAKARIRNLASLRAMQNKMRDAAGWLAAEVRKATLEMASLEEELIMRLCRATEVRDGETAAHVERVALLCREIAVELGEKAPFPSEIYLAAPMHDVGKIGVPDAILRKPGPLTAEERAIMQRHTTDGAEILSGSTSRLIQLAAEIALTHHERFDGAGYPNQIAGAAIPLSGRITAVADVFDALLSPRPYKAAWAFEDAVAHIRDNAGRHFDPMVVDAFLRVLPRLAPVFRQERQSLAM